MGDLLIVDSSVRKVLGAPNLYQVNDDVTLSRIIACGVSHDEGEVGARHRGVRVGDVAVLARPNGSKLQEFPAVGGEQSVDVLTHQVRGLGGRPLSPELDVKAAGV